MAHAPASVLLCRAGLAERRRVARRWRVSVVLKSGHRLIVNSESAIEWMREASDELGIVVTVPILLNNPHDVSPLSLDAIIAPL